MFPLQDTQHVSSWPNVFSLCLSLIVVLLSLAAENYFADWVAKLDKYASIPHNNIVTITRSISTFSLIGIICQAYQCLSTLDKLNATIMLLWSSLFVIVSTEIVAHFKPKVAIN